MEQLSGSIRTDTEPRAKGRQMRGEGAVVPGPQLMSFVFLEGRSGCWGEWVGNRAGDGAKIALGCTALAFPHFCSRARVSVRAISQRTARGVDANVTVEKGYPSLHCAIATISLPLKEQLVVSCSTALGCQRGSDQPSLHEKRANTAKT